MKMPNSFLLDSASAVEFKTPSKRCFLCNTLLSGMLYVMYTFGKLMKKHNFLFLLYLCACVNIVLFVSKKKTRENRKQKRKLEISQANSISRVVNQHVTSITP